MAKKVVEEQAKEIRKLKRIIRELKKSIKFLEDRYPYQIMSRAGASY